MSRQSPLTMFISLGTFSKMGGIQRFNRNFLKALYENSAETSARVMAFSLLDTSGDEAYFPGGLTRHYGGNKIAFVGAVLKQAFTADRVFIGHINLAFLGSLIKALRPRCEVILLTHGIEVWRDLPGVQRRLLRQCDRIWAVSAFTRTKLVERHGVAEGKISIFHNTIDPFLVMPERFIKPPYLIERYGLEGHKVFFTLTRLNSTEKFKGYDLVLAQMGRLKAEGYDFRYILGGKPDAAEAARIDSIVRHAGLDEVVIRPGFIPLEEASDHYLASDVFVMPSKKEGFGIVFIEAMLFGLRVIAGNKDGSVDALRNGELGRLIDPEDDEQIYQALKAALMADEVPEEEKRRLQQSALGYFGFDRFKERMAALLTDVLEPT